MTRKIFLYLALFVFPFLVIIIGGYAMQLTVLKMEAGFPRTAAYAAASLLIALIVAWIIRGAQNALGMERFVWGDFSSLVWGALIGFLISVSAGVGFGLAQGYPLHFENLGDGLAMNAFRQASPALGEEIVFRAGIAHSTMMLFGQTAGLAAGSAPFGILHLAGLLFGQSVTATQIFGISLAGLMLTLVYFRFGVLGAFATHLVWNAMVGGWVKVYEAADRNSVVSALEGSWVTCLVLSVACFALYFVKTKAPSEARARFATLPVLQ